MNVPKPGTLRVIGWNKQERVDTPKGFYMRDLPLPRWKELLFWYLIRPLRKLRFFAGSPAKIYTETICRKFGERLDRARDCNEEAGA